MYGEKKLLREVDKMAPNPAKLEGKIHEHSQRLSQLLRQGYH